jgi:hypothetical protein
MCLLLALCCLIVLSGCSGKREEDRQPAPTLPPAGTRYIAPDQDEVISEGGEYRIYLPGRDDLGLISRSTYLDPANLSDTAEMLVRSLIAFPGDEETRKLGGNKALDLYGDHPIEVSGGVCTVNLTSSALQLSLRDYYKNCLALATTLCELKEINSVNILTADQSVGLDITGNLPMGTLTAHPGENLPVLWEQMEAKRTPLGEDLSKTPLSTLTTLYYPLADGRGIACATRLVNFEGQTPQQLAMGLINAVSSVRKSTTGGQGFPELSELLLHDPVTSELEEGGRLITLSLSEDAEERITAGGADLACTVAALTYTLTTFIPGIAAVCIRIGDKPITELHTRHFETVTALGGLVKRSTVSSFLMGSTTVYFARNGILCECERPVDRQLADNPRAQLCALMEGPDGREQTEGIVAALPENVREDDILGIRAESDTLLVNLSEGFRSEIQEMGPDAEILICYSMVNTLCRNTGLKRVCFFFEGKQVETIAGSIYWAGEFLYNTGLAEKGLG